MTSCEFDGLGVNGRTDPLVRRVFHALVDGFREAIAHQVDQVSVQKLEQVVRVAPDDLLFVLAPLQRLRKERPHELRVAAVLQNTKISSQKV